MSIQEKDKHQKKGIEKWDIFPIKWVFTWTQTKEIISSQLYLLLERSLSPKEYLFKWNNSLLKKNDSRYNREIYNLLQSYIVIDKSKIPANFIKLFELNLESQNIEAQVESIFKKARLLDKKSARIVFVDDKIVIFRNEEKLVHKSKNLTQWEKRRSEIVTAFNTFSNIYDAVRSQYHTIQSSQEKQDDYKYLQQDILKLAQEIKVLWYWIKDLEFKRRLDWIISETQNATNAKVLAANLQNLQRVAFENKQIDSKLLEWAKNKLIKRFNDLQKIVWIVNTQLLQLENILTEYQSILEIFLRQIKNKNKDFALENYNNWYKDLFKKHWPISPFNTFHYRINKYKDNNILYEKFLNNIQNIFEVYKDEHSKKLSWKEIDKNSEKIFEEFKSIKDSLHYIEQLIPNS